jgi:ubiquinone/menaquinone biosynthesis C-methylase UbiE
MSDLKHQYDSISKDFSAIIAEGNKDSREAFNQFLPNSLKNLDVLDLGCGNGFETVRYQELGARSIVGVDASNELLQEAEKMYKHITFKHGYFEDIPLEDSSVDYIFSKYALQTSDNLEKVWPEVTRVLRPNGIFILLATHPVRQFFEKKTQPKDYFQQEVVDSICFDGSITFKEPSHTLKEYLTEYMLSHYILEGFEEKFDSAAEKIVDTYPGFILLKWKKRNNEVYD